MNRISIYGLLDPRTGDCFYVGKTKNKIEYRLQQHIVETSKNNYNKYKVIQDIINAGYKPVIKELLVVDDYFDSVLDCNVWEYYEMFCIKYVREELNQPLTNIAVGGNDLPLMTEDTKKKISINQTGIKNNFYGKRHSEETKNIIRDKVKVIYADAIKLREEKLLEMELIKDTLTKKERDLIARKKYKQSEKGIAERKRYKERKRLEKQNKKLVQAVCG